MLTTLKIYCLFLAADKKTRIMKLSNETKVGILAIVAIVVLVLGFNFLKGQNVFSKPPVLYAVFTNVGSLDKSNQVKINGLPVGSGESEEPRLWQSGRRLSRPAMRISPQAQNDNQK